MVIDLHAQLGNRMVQDCFSSPRKNRQRDQESWFGSGWF
ncbi:hypothetical protein CASFOL_020897 [Castilleja foliolosa]|uniref:Uncharacterized protein n=1 Tax=Castilleja foliolosa TaxID=1961234 RepID=A0ABD3D270_9LAMI